MAINIAGVIVAGVLIVVLAILARTSIVVTTLVGRSTLEVNYLNGEQVRTRFEFVSARGGSGDLTLKLKNTGLTPVFDFSGMDFIIEYLDALSNQVVTRLTYTTGVLANNEWKKISINPDSYEPEAWDLNETITLEALLSPTQKPTQRQRCRSQPPMSCRLIGFGPSGFFWFTDALDISLITALSWQDIDLTDDTWEYMSNTNYQTVEYETHRWQIVKIDANRVIQGYVEDTQIDFKLIGYTMGTDPLFFNSPLDGTPTTEDEWTNADVSAFVDAHADDVVLFILST